MSNTNGSTAAPEVLTEWPPAEPEPRPITVDDVLPFLSERGRVEVESAIKSIHLAIAQQEIDRLNGLLK